ncbi:MAG: hypothetical protein AB8B72_14510 [Crocinitomicaceae bacterium]
MKKQFLIYSTISIFNLCLFSGIFSLFQNPTIYDKSLGKISSNYERTGSWNNYKIQKVNKPYIEITNSNLLWWDAPIYQCISKKLYLKEEACYGKVRAAFFPLFPMLWKVTNSSAISISIINYFLYAAGLMLMFLYFASGSAFTKSTNFALLLAFPTTIIFFIPYTEALFLFCFTIAAVGILKNKNLLYFLGAFLTAMVRPATIFVLFAILLAEVFSATKHKNLKLYLQQSFFRGLPFGLGYTVALGIQRGSSGSWTAFTDAHAYWAGGIQKLEAIVDWSIEGFGMNVFAIIFISVPALIFVFYLMLDVLTKSKSFLSSLQSNKTNYLFLISALYISGLLIFTVLTSSGNLHSYFRFTMTSPLFYLAAIILLGYLSHSRTRYAVLCFAILIILFALFFYNVPYGGNRLAFSFVGMYLLVATSGYLLIRSHIPKLIDLPIILLLIVSNSIWTTFLFNSYLSNGWIFT